MHCVKHFLSFFLSFFLTLCVCVCVFWNFAMTKEKRFSFSGLSKPNAMNKPKKYTTSPSAEQFLLREKVDDGIHFYAHCKRGSGNPALASGEPSLVSSRDDSSSAWR